MGIRVIAKQDMEDKVRTIVKLAGVTGALVLAACSGKDSAMSADLKKDLELASTASTISLPASQPAAQVVSAIERTTPPAPRRVAPSQRVAKHRPAPRNNPAPVEVQRGEISEEVEPAPVEPAPSPNEAISFPSPRPQPVASSGSTGGGDIGAGRGNTGVGIGTIIGVVLRGGVVDGDECDPRTDGRRGRGGVNTAINNRLPPIIGTFPGSGRLGGNVPVVLGGGSGRVRF